MYVNLFLHLPLNLSIYEFKEMQLFNNYVWYSVPIFSSLSSLPSNQWQKTAPRSIPATIYSSYWLSEHLSVRNQSVIIRSRFFPSTSHLHLGCTYFESCVLQSMKPWDNLQRSFVFCMMRLHCHSRLYVS